MEWVGFLKKTGQWLGNYGKGIADSALSTVGMSDVIRDDHYKGAGKKLFKGISDVTEVVNPIAAQIGATALGGPMAGQAMAGLQGAGNQVNGGLVAQQDAMAQNQIMGQQYREGRRLASGGIETRGVVGGYYKNGGTIAPNKKEDSETTAMTNIAKADTMTQEQQNWVNNYVNSDGYKKRLAIELQGNTTAAAQMQQARAGRLGAGYELVDQIHNESKGKIMGAYIYPQKQPIENPLSMLTPQAKSKAEHGKVLIEAPFAPVSGTETSRYGDAITTENTPAHEFIHQSTDGDRGLTPYAKDRFGRAQKSLQGQPNAEYLSSPTEIHSRLGVLRYMMDKEGIYNSNSGQDMKREDIMKVLQSPELMKDRNINQLFEQIYKGRYEDIITDMNTVASNNTAKQVSYGAMGGNLEPQYEVEGDEVVQGTDVHLEGTRKLASDMQLAVGPRHEEGA